MLEFPEFSVIDTEMGTNYFYPFCLYVQADWRLKSTLSYVSKSKTGTAHCQLQKPFFYEHGILPQAN